MLCLIVILVSETASWAVLSTGQLPGFRSGLTGDPIIARAGNDEVVIKLSDLRELYRSLDSVKKRQVARQTWRKLTMVGMLADDAIMRHISRKEVVLSGELLQEARRQSIIQEYLSREITNLARRVTDGEVKEFYEQNKHYYSLIKYVVSTVKYNTMEQADYFRTTCESGVKFKKALDLTKSQFSSSEEGGEGEPGGGEGEPGGGQSGGPPQEGGSEGEPGGNPGGGPPQEGGSEGEPGGNPGGEPPQEGGSEGAPGGEPSQGGGPPQEGGSEGSPGGGGPGGEPPQEGGSEGGPGGEGSPGGGEGSEEISDDEEEIGEILAFRTAYELWEIPVAFSEAMVGVRPGQCALPVDPGDGKPVVLFFHDKYREYTPFIEIKDEIKRALRSHVRLNLQDQVLKRLMSKYGVEINHELLTKVNFSDQVPSDLSMSQVLVKISGSDITINDWYQAIKQTFQILKPGVEDLAIQKVFYLNELIADRIILREALDKGYSGETHLDKISDNMRVESFINRHEEENEEVYSQYIVPDVEVEKYYEQNKDNLYVDKFSLQVLLYLDKEVAGRVRENAARSNIFSDSAKKMSIDKTKGKPFEVEADKLDPMVRQTVLNLEPGGISQVISTPAGYFIIKYNGVKRYKYESIDGYLERIISILEERKKTEFRKEWLQGLRKKMGFEIDEDRILEVDLK